MGCGANLRSIALANAIRGVLGTSAVLREALDADSAQALKVLEVNEAGTLTPVLQKLPGHTLAMYPAIDMHRMPYESELFDLVVHSDTLEHVDDPVHALTECWRVLRKGGALCFTAPTIVGRLSRSRAGLPKSFHGNAEVGSDDFSVKTEFGADIWVSVCRAGFEKLTLHVVEFPAALAIAACRS